MVKLNWDAGLNVKEGCVGLGFIVKDLYGNYLATQTEAPTTEAFAAVYALIFLQGIGLYKHHFLGQCLVSDQSH
jgi:hypothetical protein